MKTVFLTLLALGCVAFAAPPPTVHTADVAKAPPSIQTAAIPDADAPVLSAAWEYMDPLAPCALAFVNPDTPVHLKAPPGDNLAAVTNEAVKMAADAYAANEKTTALDHWLTWHAPGSASVLADVKPGRQYSSGGASYGATKVLAAALLQI